MNNKELDIAIENLVETIQQIAKNFIKTYPIEHIQKQMKNLNHGCMNKFEHILSINCDGEIVRILQADLQQHQQIRELLKDEISTILYEMVEEHYQKQHYNTRD